MHEKVHRQVKFYLVIESVIRNSKRCDMFLLSFVDYSIGYIRLIAHRAGIFFM